MWRRPWPGTTLWLLLCLFVGPLAASPERIGMAFAEAYRAADLKRLTRLFLFVPTSGVPVAQQRGEARRMFRQQLRNEVLRGYRVIPLSSRERQRLDLPAGIRPDKRLELRFAGRQGQAERRQSYLIVYYNDRWQLWFARR